VALYFSTAARSNFGVQWASAGAELRGSLEHYQPTMSRNSAADRNGATATPPLHRQLVDLPNVEDVDGVDVGAAIAPVAAGRQRATPPAVRRAPTPASSRSAPWSSTWIACLQMLSAWPACTGSATRYGRTRLRRRAGVWSFRSALQCPPRASETCGSVPAQLSAPRRIRPAKTRVGSYYLPSHSRGVTARATCHGGPLLHPSTLPVLPSEPKRIPSCTT